MDIKEIKTQYNNLNSELKTALSRMEYTDRIVAIRDAIKDLQMLCPHDDGHVNFSKTPKCPYCGRKFGE